MAGFSGHARLACSLATAVLVLLLAAPGARADAPAAAGVTQPPTAVYTEHFENGPPTSPILRLSDYSGASGQHYTADPAWLTRCNGWIAAAVQPVNPAAQSADCNTAAAGRASNGQHWWDQTQQLAVALGLHAGAVGVDAEANHAVSAFTSANPGGDKVEFATESNIPLPTSSRFLAFSVDVAALNCAVSAPRLQFSLIPPGGAAIPAGARINGCSSGTNVLVPARGAVGAASVRVGTYTTNDAVLFSGSSVGIRMVNGNGSGTGNDHAFDNIRILDVTPRLDKSFSPSTVTPGQKSMLTLTITNTSDLAAKTGWSFVDSLPTGLSVAGAPTSTCATGKVTAVRQSANITLTGGKIAAGNASCTVTVPVSGAAGSYTNGPANVTEVGLDAPADTTLVIAPVVDTPMADAAVAGALALLALMTAAGVFLNRRRGRGAA